MQNQAKKQTASTKSKECWKLYLSYTEKDLKAHAAQLKKMALARGCWEVIDGWQDRQSRNDREMRMQLVKESDALIALSAYWYGAPQQPTTQEDKPQSYTRLEFEAALREGKPVRALLADPNALWLPRLIEATSNPSAQPHLNELTNILLSFSSGHGFSSKATSIKNIAKTELEGIEEHLENRRGKSVFIVRDFSVEGLPTVLEAIERRPPKGFTINVPGTDLEYATGELFSETVFKGIDQSDRVLVVADLPNANVAFEAGIALGLKKPLALIHYGKNLPKWLNSTLFKNFLIYSVEGPEDIRKKMIDETFWFHPAESSSVPYVGNTLFLCPRKHVGEALIEEQKEIKKSWTTPEEIPLKDLEERFSRIAQLVWALAPYATNTDDRDGTENATNAALAGWFYARLFKTSEERIPSRFHVLRHKSAREIVDVSIFEKQFNGLDDFGTIISQIGEVGTPPKLSLPNAFFGPCKYEMVLIPPELSRAVLGPESGRVYVGKFLVTNSQYRAFIDANKGVAAPVSLSKRHFDSPDQPVCGLSADDAESFCRWSFLELPSENLWKLIAVGDLKTSLDQALGPDLMESSWIINNAEGRTQPVGRKDANIFGLFDLFGNVWEWTATEIEISVEPANYLGVVPINAKERVRIACGGAWDSMETEIRGSGLGRQFKADAGKLSVGFRCVRIED